MDQPFRTVPRALAAHVLQVHQAGLDARLITDLALFSETPAATLDPADRRTERARMAALLGLADKINSVDGMSKLWLQAQTAADAVRDDLAVALATGRVELSPEQLRRAYLGRGL